MKTSASRKRLYGIILVVLVTVATLITLWDAARLRAAYRMALENYALAEARDVREVIHRDLDVLPLVGLTRMNTVLIERVGASDLLSYAYITDDQGRVLYHTQPAHIGTRADVRLFDQLVFRGTSDKQVFEREGAYEVVVPLLHTDELVGALHVAVGTQTMTVQVRNMVLFHVFPFIGVALGVSMAFFTFMSWYVTRPMARMVQGLEAVGAGDFGYTLRVEREDEVGTSVQAFNAMTARLQAFVAGLEQRVADRTHDLERQSARLRAATEVGRAVTSILNAEQLIEQVVSLIRQRFNMYYVGLFLVDEEGAWAVLRASSGTEGEELLGSGFRIPVGEGLIGWSIINARARLASDVREDHVRMDVRELPDTRSEVALPLRSRGQVIGAISVQSDQYHAFDEEFIEVLQTLADEVAVAIDNARLFARNQAALDAERRVYGELTRRGWQKLLATRGAWGYEYHGQRIEMAGEVWDETMAQAVRAGQRVTDESATRLAIPIRERQEVVGVLGLEKPDADQAWSAEEIALLETLAERLGVALESARSYQETQQRAAREQLTGAITARIRESLDIDQVMQTAVEQIREAFGLHDAIIRLGDVDTPLDREQ